MPRWSFSRGWADSLSLSRTDKGSDRRYSDICTQLPSTFPFGMDHPHRGSHSATRDSFHSPSLHHYAVIRQPAGSWPSMFVFKFDSSGVATYPTYLAMQWSSTLVLSPSLSLLLESLLPRLLEAPPQVRIHFALYTSSQALTYP